MINVIELGKDQQHGQCLMKIHIRTNILLHFLLILITVSSILIGFQYYFMKKMAIGAIDSTFHQVAHNTALEIKKQDLFSKEILYQLKGHPDLSHYPDAKSMENVLRHFIHTLLHHKNIYAIYLGYNNGDLFEVINMQASPLTYERFRAPRETRWTMLEVTDEKDGTRVRRLTYYDEKMHILGKNREQTQYIVNVRPWYQDALASEGSVRSGPYFFSNLKTIGITYASKIDKSNTVLALDFTLDRVVQVLQNIPFSKEGIITILDGDGAIMATSNENVSAVNDAMRKLAEEKEIDTIVPLHVDDRTYFAILIPLSIELGKSSYVAIAIDRETIVAPYRKQAYYAIGIALLLLLLFIPLTILLTHYIVKPIKALMRENEQIKQRKFESVKPIESNILEFVALSDSQIAMSKSIQNYQKKLETLLDSFIRLIADAIDAKSAYTGSHCKKVPVIASMLAKEAENAKSGVLKEFKVGSEDAWSAFERAAWLHDCGKITTPEYVVDKATKLETIYNRIHEIRTRFEVLWRDIEIEYYERLINGESEAKLKAWKEDEHKRLQEEFAFVAQCNVGTEFMEYEKIEHLKKIADRTWMRHFDDRLGLADEELTRYNTTEPLPLPTMERLLDDKHYHLIERVDFDEEAYRRERFTLPVPQYLYNRGELYNLCVQKGTLTEEERFKINEHVIMTIKMLERLPFPENMKEIPTVAGEHHETLDGRGYPRSLTEHDLSIPSRILAIADIFEALTASDRPYKKSKTLSEALAIMKKMKEERHIDAELFGLFITSGVYRTYAKAYLKPEQIDEVDEASLLK